MFSTIDQKGDNAHRSALQTTDKHLVIEFCALAISGDGHFRAVRYFAAMADHLEGIKFISVVGISICEVIAGTAGESGTVLAVTVVECRCYAVLWN